MLTQLSASETANVLRKRDASVREVLDAHLARIREHEPSVGAFLEVCEDQAVSQAVAAQRSIDDGSASALCGIPIAVKDNLSTTDVRTTCGSKLLEGYVPTFDATVVQNVKSQGGIVIGKANMDEFAMGSSCENSAYFPTRNPWDPDRAAGGSSGGSAAAVAAEFAPLSLGSDTGGSIRMPAALCGIVGFKPTYGRVSRYGLIAFGSSLDQVGPLARTVEDAAILAHAVSGHDLKDSTSIPHSQIAINELKSGSLKGLRIGLPKQLFGDAVQPGVKDCIDMAVTALQREGVIFETVDLPSIDLGVTTYYIIAPAEASSNLARFDGIRFGQQVESEGHSNDVAATRGRLFGHEVKLRIMVGTYALSSGYYDAFYHRAQQVRGLMSDEFEQSFQRFDCLLSPTSPVVAFKLGALTEDPLALKLLDLCTIPANLGGFPSLSLPCGFSEDLPVGLCLTGPVMSDERLLQIAYAVEQCLPWGHRRTPMP